MAAARSVLRVLIVEDNPVIRDLFLLGMNKLKSQLPGDPIIEVQQAEDGAQAWTLLVKGGVDLLVVDLYLPVLNGLDLIKRLRDNDGLKDIKILAISASIQDARDRSLGAGADQFLQKPLRLTDLMLALKELVAHPPKSGQP